MNFSRLRWTCVSLRSAVNAQSLALTHLTNYRNRFPLGLIFQDHNIGRVVIDFSSYRETLLEVRSSLRLLVWQGLGEIEIEAMIIIRMLSPDFNNLRRFKQQIARYLLLDFLSPDRYPKAEGPIIIPRESLLNLEMANPSSEVLSCPTWKNLRYPFFGLNSVIGRWTFDQVTLLISG